MRWKGVRSHLLRGGVCTYSIAVKFGSSLRPPNLTEMVDRSGTTSEGMSFPFELASKDEKAKTSNNKILHFGDGTKGSSNEVHAQKTGSKLGGQKSKATRKQGGGITRRGP